jgi:hypothetical protein
VKQYRLIGTTFYPPSFSVDSPFNSYSDCYLNFSSSRPPVWYLCSMSLSESFPYRRTTTTASELTVLPSLTETGEIGSAYPEFANIVAIGL